MAYKLGKKEARRDDRTFRMAKYLNPGLLPPPAQVDHTSKIKNWPMWANDKIGDCTCAGAGHAIQQWTAYTRSHAFLPTENEIIAAYSRISGFDPDDPSTDHGCVLLDVLKSWRKDGIAKHKIMAFAALEKKNRHDLMDAVHLFGNAYIGVNLPRSAQNQEVWHVPDGGLIGLGAPGSWGGHCVIITSYDSRGLSCVTWGAVKRLSWNFYDAYCDEAYAILSTDWFDENGISPDHFKCSDLKADLARL